MVMITIHGVTVTSISVANASIDLIASNAISAMYAAASPIALITNVSCTRVRPQNTA